jgi:hypothetical protein
MIFSNNEKKNLRQLRVDIKKQSSLIFRRPFAYTNNDRYIIL